MFTTVASAPPSAAPGTPPPGSATGADPRPSRPSPPPPSVPAPAPQQPAQQPENRHHCPHPAPCHTSETSNTPPQVIVNGRPSPRLRAVRRRGNQDPAYARVPAELASGGSDVLAGAGAGGPSRAAWLTRTASIESNGA